MRKHITITPLPETLPAKMSKDLFRVIIQMVQYLFTKSNSLQICLLYCSSLTHFCGWEQILEAFISMIENLSQSKCDLKSHLLLNFSVNIYVSLVIRRGVGFFLSWIALINNVFFDRSKIRKAVFQKSFFKRIYMKHLLRRELQENIHTI